MPPGTEQPRERQNLRHLLLKYVLYNTFVRSSTWDFAVFNQTKRLGFWCNALKQAVERHNSAVVLYATSQGEVPVIPFLLAISQPEDKLQTCVIEDKTPLKRIISDCIVCNGLEKKVTLIDGPEKQLQFETAVLGIPDCVLCCAPGLEVLTNLPAALSCIKTMGRNVPAAWPAVQVVPVTLSIKAIALHVPPQTAPVRAPITSVSGFDLTAFNMFRNTAGSDAIRLADIEHTPLSAVTTVCCTNVEDLLSLTNGNGEISVCWSCVLSILPQVAATSPCNAVAVWINVSLSDFPEIVWDNGPADHSRRQHLFWLPKDVSTACDLAIHLGLHDGTWSLVSPTQQPAEQSAAVTSCSTSSSLGNTSNLPEPCNGDALSDNCKAGVRLEAMNGTCSSAAANVHSNDSLEALAELEDPEESAAGANVYIERWHFSMVNDRHRNSAYQHAIEQAVRFCKKRHGYVHVLDIGSGSGLLAMMAAKAGANHVTAVECIRPLAECSKEIIAKNGFAGVIEVVIADSNKLTLHDLPRGKGNLLVSEIMDDGLLGEGLVPTLAHARHNLLHAGSFVIPAHASIWGMLVSVPIQPEPVAVPSWARLDGLAPDRDLAGLVRQLNLAPFDDFIPGGKSQYHSIRADRLEHTPLCHPFQVFLFDFNRPLYELASQPTFSRISQIRTEATASGTANAIVFWFTVTLLPDRIGNHQPGVRNPQGAFVRHSDFCTYPFQADSCGSLGSSRCWSQAIQFLSEVRPVEASQPLRLTAKHAPSHVEFSWALPDIVL